MSTTAWNSTAATVHARAYAERMLTAVGLQPKMVHAKLRMESGVPVAGLVVRAKKFVVARTSYKKLGDA